jgi:hypothetical protein
MIAQNDAPFRHDSHVYPSITSIIAGGLIAVGPISPFRNTDNVHCWASADGYITDPLPPDHSLQKDIARRDHQSTF